MQYEYSLVCPQGYADTWIYGKEDMAAKHAGTYAGSGQRHYSGEHADENVSDIPLSGQGGAVFLILRVLR